MKGPRSADFFAQHKPVTNPFSNDPGLQPLQ